jgi:two-component system, OmpR family, copper resistance phosphate regulon response regulator CusR
VSRILIAEDEVRISSFIEKGLRASGLATTVVANGVQALALARSGEFDLMILDIGLPELDGFTVLHALRSESDDLPVLILTARDGIDDTVAGLVGGADDYMAKPFHFEELLARIQRRLRTPSRSVGTNVLTHNGISLDLNTRRLTCEGKTSDLTAREFTLAQLFLTHPGQVLSREQLLSRVWGYDYEPGSNVVETYVRYLRRKVGPDRIETVRGMGYRLRD